jgi:hypothetical protein
MIVLLHFAGIAAAHDIAIGFGQRASLSKGCPLILLLNAEKNSGGAGLVRGNPRF